MNRLLLVIIGILALSMPVSAQVIVDFETDAGGFADNGWGTGFASVGWAADPSGKSVGVLKMSFDGTRGGKGDIQKDNVNGKGAHIMMYYLWLPANIPDSIGIKLWAQDKNTWTWTQQYYRTKDLPKGTWVPLSFFMEQYRIDVAHFTFDAKTYEIGKMGIEVEIWDETDADRNWAGDIFVDNVSLVGVEPRSFADFEVNDNGYAKGGWGTLITAVSRVADPSGKSAGVLKMTVNGTGSFDKEAVAKYTIDAKDAIVMAYYLWLPAGTPDQLAIKPYAQDADNWTYEADYYTAANIPRDVWFPIYFNMKAAEARNTGFDFSTTQTLNGGGLEFQMSGATWTGDVYLDNVSFAGITTGAKWVIADFNAAAGGTYGFAVEGWGPAFTSLSNIVDPGNSNNRVLKVGASFATGQDKGNLAKQNVTLWSADADTFAHEINYKLWIPADLPGEPQVSLQYTGTTGTWSEQNAPWHGSPDSLVKGQWNTIRYNALAKYQAAEIDPTKPGAVRLQVYYSVVETWAGDFYLDDVTLVGIPQPQGALVSPTVVASKDTSLAPFKEWFCTRIEWVDNTLGSEAYNVYASPSAISNLTAPGVVQIAANVPHGLQLWGERPWTTDGATTTRYYAVTATDGITETPLSDACKAGPFTYASSATPKVQYVADFATKFVIDGVGDEFAPYAAYQMTPEGASGPQAASWTPASTDINYKVTFVIDNNHLYIYADVTDDDLRTDPAGQSWEGDAIEFYMGYYDVRFLTALHPYGVQGSLGDWRIGFNSQGFISLNGGSSTTVPGVTGSDYGILAKLTADGYVVEAKLNLDSLAQGKKFNLVNGMFMPLKIDLNDWDPLKGDTGRRQIAQFGGIGVDVDQSWLRPGTWGYLEVVGAPLSVSDEDALPTEFRLYHNYPNPFNPATIIRYDLKEDVDVTVKVYSTLGQEVATLVNEHQKAGRYSVNFNASRLASGMYVYTIRAGSYVATHKMMFLK